MSVSHPLAAGGFQEDAHRDLQEGGSGDRAVGTKDGVDAATPSTPALSTLPEQVLIAPERLGLESRVEFRRVAYELIERTAQGNGRLVIGCEGLRSIDSAGLNALILVQRKASSRRVRVSLRNPDHEIRSLLVLTKLDDLFELSEGKSEQALG